MSYPHYKKVATEAIFKDQLTPGYLRSHKAVSSYPHKVKDGADATGYSVGVRIYYIHSILLAEKIIGSMRADGYIDTRIMNMRAQGLKKGPPIFWSSSTGLQILLESRA